MCLGKVLAHPYSCTSRGCPGKRQIHFRSRRILLAEGWNLLMCSSHRTGPLSPWFVKPLCLSSCSGTRTERGWELRRGAGTGWLLPARWATGQPHSRYLCSCHGQFLGEHHTPDPRLKPRLEAKPCPDAAVQAGVRLQNFKGIPYQTPPKIQPRLPLQ